MRSISSTQSGTVPAPRDSTQARPAVAASEGRTASDIFWKPRETGTSRFRKLPSDAQTSQLRPSLGRLPVPKQDFPCEYVFIQACLACKCVVSHDIALRWLGP